MGWQARMLLGRGGIGQAIVHAFEARRRVGCIEPARDPTPVFERVTPYASLELTHAFIEGLLNRAVGLDRRQLWPHVPLPLRNGRL